MRLTLAVLLLLSLCALPAQAQSGADVAITIVPPDGSEPRTLRVADLGAPDRRNVRYPMPGGARATVTGWTLATVLEAAGFPAGSYDLVEVARPGGGVVEIGAGEVRRTELKTVRSERYDDPKATLDERWTQREVERATPVLLVVDASGARLLRPPTAATRAQALAAVDGALTLTLVSDAKVLASPQAPRPGEQVTFTATPPRGVDRARVTYRWDFGDGRVETGGPQMTHTYAKARTYAVTVTFLLDGAALDEQAGTTVYVAEPLAPGTAGDRRGDGGRRRGRRARGSGPGAGVGGGGGSGAGGGTGGGSGGGGGAGAGDGGWSEPWDDGAAAPAEAVPPAVEEPAPAPARPRRRTPRRRAPEPPARGETVTGYLLTSGGGGGAGALPEDAPRSLRELAREPTEAASHARQLPTIAWVIAGLVGLVALGWALEGRRTLPYWQP